MDKRLKKSFFTSEVNLAWKNKLLTSFKVLIDFLDRYNLKWCLAMGSCLGAVREKGMIPWDFDIDIVMFRKDYERFKHLLSEHPIEGYELQTIENSYYNIDNCSCFTDLSSTRIFWRRVLYITGVGSVDIDILDNTYDDMELACDNYKKYMAIHYKLRDLVANYSIGNLWYYFTHHQTSRALRNILYRGLDKKAIRRKLIDQFHGLYTHSGAETSKYVVRYCIYYPGKNIWPREWFVELVDAEFEGLVVKIPKMYDAYLTYLYGDYMTPPPMEKRDAMHEIDYFNLEKRLTYKEIMEEIHREGR